jgi:hypothetical protein
VAPEFSGAITKRRRPRVHRFLLEMTADVFRKPAQLTDVVYTPERATALQNPPWSKDVITHTTVFDPATSMQTVTVRSTHPMSEGNKESLHLKVTLTRDQNHQTASWPNLDLQKNARAEIFHDLFR